MLFNAHKGAERHTIEFKDMNDLLYISGFIATAFWIIQILFALLEHRKIISNKKLPHIAGISVIVPVFNENQESIKKTAISLLAQENVNLEIIIVDDGSDVPIRLNMPGVSVLTLTSNQGKRRAQMEAIKLAKYDWIATVDSDTVLDPLALYNLYLAAHSKNAHAATGNVLLQNDRETWLTKITSCMYWFSFCQERASQSFFGSVICCSGALSIYKKDLVISNETKYLNQKFLGLECRAGDDRHLTNLFLMTGHRVVWAKNAIGRTYSPPTIAKFLKQQIRWTRSHVASFSYVCREIKNWTLPFLLFNVKLNFKYFYQFLVYASMISAMITTQSVVPLAMVVGALLVVTLIKTVIAILYTRDLKFGWLLGYSLFSFFILNPVLIYGLLTPWRIGWLTRNKI